VTKEPVSEKGVAGIVLALLAVVITIVILVQIRRRKTREETVANGDHLDNLMMMGRYSDDASDEEDDETGIEATTII